MFKEDDKEKLAQKVRMSSMMTFFFTGISIGFWISLFRESNYKKRYLIPTLPILMGGILFNNYRS